MTEQDKDEEDKDFSTSPYKIITFSLSNSPFTNEAIALSRLARYNDLITSTLPRYPVTFLLIILYYQKYARKEPEPCEPSDSKNVGHVDKAGPICKRIMLKMYCYGFLFCLLHITAESPKNPPVFTISTATEQFPTTQLVILSHPPLLSLNQKWFKCPFVFSRR